MGIAIDYSTARPAVAAMKSAGVTAVGRYLGWDGVSGYPDTGKNLTKTEAGQIHAIGASIFLAFEYNANAPALGAEQGAKDGVLATEQLTALDAPTNMGVYFAVDFDIPDYAPSLANTPSNAMEKLGPVGQYFAAIKALKPHYQIGVYGGYWTVSRVLNAGLATLAWQTVGWSGGNIDSRINVYQTTEASPFKNCDMNEIRNNSYGQWAPVEAVTVGDIVVPDVTGNDAYLAVKTLTEAGLHPHGTPLPVIKSQSPAPGTKVAKNTVISLTYEP